MAWSLRKETILLVSADDVVCTPPIGRLTGIESFHGFHASFTRMTTNLTVLAANCSAEAYALNRPAPQ